MENFSYCVCAKRKSNWIQFEWQIHILLNEWMNEWTDGWKEENKILSVRWGEGKVLVLLNIHHIACKKAIDSQGISNDTKENERTSEWMEEKNGQSKRKSCFILWCFHVPKQVLIFDTFIVPKKLTLMEKDFLFCFFSTRIIWAMKKN
jgi:hypothetical protein